jgi:hypothetical protein
MASRLAKCHGIKGAPVRRDRGRFGAGPERVKYHRYLPTVTRGPCPQTAPWWQATVGSWTDHHGHVGARLHRRRWWPGAAAATVLGFVYGLYGLCGVSDASGSPSSVGPPTHPQILTCAEEATQFTGTLPPIGPHDIGFGPGYFPHARLLATMNP